MRRRCLAAVNSASAHTRFIVYIDMDLTEEYCDFYFVLRYIRSSWVSSKVLEKGEL